MLLHIKSLRALLMIAALGVVASCDSPTPSTETGDHRYSVYRHSMAGSPSSLDPAQASNLYANFLAVNL